MKSFPIYQQLNAMDCGLTCLRMIAKWHGLVRWGLSVFLLVLVGIICLSWFIRYPDIVTAKAKLT